MMQRAWHRIKRGLICGWKWIIVWGFVIACSIGAYMGIEIPEQIGMILPIAIALVLLGIGIWQDGDPIPQTSPCGLTYIAEDVEKQIRHTKQRYSQTTRAALSLFLAVSTTMLFTACSLEPTDSNTKDRPELSYTIQDNGDGTKTAVFADGKSVRYTEDAEGHISFIKQKEDEKSQAVPAAGMPMSSVYDAAGSNLGSAAYPLRSDDSMDMLPYAALWMASTSANNTATSSAGSSYTRTMPSMASAGSASRFGSTAISSVKTGFGGAGVRGGAS